MLKLIDKILHQFRICFKREETFAWFVTIMIGLLIRPDIRGISSIVGCLSLNPRYYESMLHFFRSKAYELKSIKRKWQTIASSNDKLVELDGSMVIVGDHIKVPKEARHMPGVKKLRQDSENVGKAEYIFGHQFGMVGILAKDKTMQCIPVDIELQDGTDEVERLEEEAPPISKGQGRAKQSDTSVTKMIQMASNFAAQTSQKAILLLDAFFVSKYAFDAAQREAGNITLITRGKKNTVAFESPEPPKKKKPGRPRKYGDKVILRELFKNTADTFTTVTMSLYGKEETIEYLCKNLIWRPTGRMLRFVMVRTGENTMILMCSDLTMDPEKIILAYSYRFKIEVSFKMLKQNLGGFFYHFWTAAMPKISRFKTNSDLSSITEDRDKKKIISTMRAIEVYTFLSCMALGILSMISLSFPGSVWDKFSGWLRTRSSQNPSVETVRSVLRQKLWRNIYNLNSHATLANIHRYQKPYKERFYKNAA